MIPNPEPARGSEASELDRLLDAVSDRCGVNFRDYARSSLKRRVMFRVVEERACTISGLCARVLEDQACMERLLMALTIHVSAMFRDPGFYAVIRAEVAPVLRTYPFLRFWVAGCSTGEEVYSLAILLHEEGLYPRSRIYATDLNESVIEKARTGVFPLSTMREYTRNYQLAGGQGAFAEYYTADQDLVIFRPFLRENMIFAAHNLAEGASFNEFHMILCRNVMIYFNRSLQDRVHKLFHESLIMFGHLGLGRSESVRFSSFEPCYETLSPKERIYRKIK
jgi:chemotaxis protein methyltransferase CheR